MKSYDRNFYELLTQVGQTYVIPSFQRNYAWDIAQWEVLWNDIVFLSQNPQKYHYTGSLVYIPSEEHSTYVREVIDGQQRLTTISLMYLAAYTLLRSGEITGYDPNHLRVQVLENQYGVEKERLKLKPAGADGEVYEKIFDDARQAEVTPVEKASNIYRCYKFFLTQLAKSGLSIDELIRAAQRLQVIEIVLNQDDDHPQKVFESINSTGKQLSVDDLIRNYILMRGNYVQREAIYKKYWRPIENRLQKDNESLLEDFFTTYIKLTLAKDITKADLYPQFKQLYDTQSHAEPFLDDLLEYAGIYEYIKFDRGVYSDVLKPLRYYVDVLNLLKIDVYYIFLLPVIRAFLHEEITKEDLLATIDFIVNYQSRRILSGKTTTSLNKYMPSLYNKMLRYKKDLLSDVLIYDLTVNAPSQIAYPTDEEVRQGIATREFYSRRDTCRYILLAVDNANQDNQHKHLLFDSSLTIEHVMPQTLSAAWRQDLGEAAQETYDRYINNIANLTMTAYNSSYSNKPYKDKLRTEEKNGLAESPLLINSYFRTVTKWTAAQLAERQAVLTEQLLTIFPAKRAVHTYKNKIDDDYKSIDNIHDQWGREVLGMMIADELFAVDSWKGAYVQCCQYIAQLIGYEPLVNIFLGITTGQALISKDETSVVGPASIGNGYYVAASKSSGDILTLMTKLIDKIDDLERADVKLRLNEPDGGEK